jgi:hypothetical protein
MATMTRASATPALIGPVRRRGSPFLAAVLFAYRLESAMPGTPVERLSQCAQLLPRLSAATATLPGVSRAIELRFIVEPTVPGTGRAESVTCLLIARYTDWTCARAQRHARAADFARELGALLAVTISDHTFTPVTHADAVRRALDPFPIVDTGEARRRAPDGAPAPGLPLPFLGIPDVEPVIDMMLRRDAPSVLSICVEPAALGAMALATAVEDRAGSGEESESPHRRWAAPDEPHGVLALTRVRDEATHIGWQVQRVLALRQQAYRLRIQLAGATRLGDGLINTLVGELSGLGRNTARAAWEDPTAPLGGVEWVRPRSTRPRTPRSGTRSHEDGQGKRTLTDRVRSEHDIALANLRTLDFAPWGADRVDATGGHGDWLYLADLSETARMFALPGATSWLAQRGFALALPFAGGPMEGVRLGVNRVRGVERPVWLPSESRAQHVWICGATGTGKSTLLESQILQDVLADRGVIVIDPHGELIDRILTRIPARRARDVILFDPADTAHPVGLNPLEAANEDERAMVVSAFLGLLQKLYDPHHQGIVGPRFENGVRNTMLTVMERPGATLVEFIRCYTDDAFRRELVANLKDPIVKRYWTDQIDRTQDFHRSEVLDWIVSKFNRFVTDPTIRRIIGQSQSGFSFRAAMDTGKIVLLSLAKGRVGADNANFLGLVLLPKILQAALARVDTLEAARRPVNLYIDEFQNYATDALAQMLSEARKYHLGLTLANQHIGQLTQDVRDAVIGNVGSVVAFRLGVGDATAMREILAPSPIATQHLTDLPDYTAYARLLADGRRLPALTLATEPVTIAANVRRGEDVRTRSRKTYGRPRAEVDAEINQRAHLDGPKAPTSSGIFRLTS